MIEKDNNPLEDDPEFYFDQSQFNTLMINTDEFAKKNEAEIRNLISLVTSKETEEKREALKLLKVEKGQEMLLYAIASPEFKEYRAKLLAACWESGLDFTKYFEFFLQLVLNADYQSSLEAITVVENMEGKIPEELRTLAIEKLLEAVAAGNEKSELFKDLVAHLNSAGE